MSTKPFPIKTVAMGGVAVVAIILAIVVAIKTFSDPKDSSTTSPTELISGTWTRVARDEPSELPPGAPAQSMVMKGLTAFDANNAAGSPGTVTLTYADGSTIIGKVMLSALGYLKVQVPTMDGKKPQITIMQMGESGATMVNDGLSNLQFEPAK